MFLKTSKKIIHWTAHSREKMRFYGLSEARLKRVIHSPQRIEEGIAPDTVAMMQSAGSAKHPYEIWLMMQTKRQGSGVKRQEITKIISAWRYPGRTKPGQSLPAEILRELKNCF